MAQLKARWALCVSSVQPRTVKAAVIDRRVLHGALSRLEPGAGKLARRVLRGGGDREVSPLPDELPLSRRDGQQAKEAERLEPKGMRPGRSANSSLLADGVPSAERQSLTPPGVVLVRNVVSPIVSTRRWKVTRKGAPVDEGVRDAGGSEGRAVITRIGVRTLPCPERGLTSGRSWITRKGRKG